MKEIKITLNEQHVVIKVDDGRWLSYTCKDEVKAEELYSAIFDMIKEFQSKNESI